MAAIIIPIFLGPNEVLSTVNLFRQKYKFTTDPKDTSWKKLTIDVVMPVHNEERRIVMSLNSITKQSVTPGKVFLIDDASNDNTISLAQDLAQALNINLEVIRRAQNAGKTPSLAYGVENSSADVLFILDGDTVLTNPDYFARVLEELNKNADIASVCGIVYTMNKSQYHEIYDNDPTLKHFIETHRGTKKYFRFGEEYVSTYRTLLYTFLQRFVYRSQMMAMGTIINPVGCAVGYRRSYLKELFERHEKDLGHDLSTSEDIFIGFSFNNHGFRNIQLEDISCVTQDPSLRRLFKQIFLWSSAFFQCCYYFKSLVATPFKFLRSKFNNKKDQDPNVEDLGIEYTKKYGRPIGWYIFFSLIEKITFPIMFVITIFFQLWLFLLITVVCEIIAFATVIAVVNPPKTKLAGAAKSVKMFPLRYLLLFFDIPIFLKFLADLLLGRNRKWRK